MAAAVKAFAELCLEGMEANREALALSRLNHPNIEMVLDLGEEGGTHYLVLELVEGESLAARLAREKLGVAEALRAAAHVAAGVAEAHRLGILHGDLKPPNILVTRAGRRRVDQVAVADFGHAQWLTAGKGIVHAEMFPLLERDRGNPLELFQIWVNLPAELKMSHPRYQDVSAARVPVVRREDGRLRRYAHLGTGNYHPRTARQYTDFGLLTADPDLCHDVNEVFLHITESLKWQDEMASHTKTIMLYPAFVGTIVLGDYVDIEEGDLVKATIDEKDFMIKQLENYITGGR